MQIARELSLDRGETAVRSVGWDLCFDPAHTVVESVPPIRPAPTLNALVLHAGAGLDCAHRHLQRRTAEFQRRKGIGRLVHANPTNSLEPEQTIRVVALASYASIGEHRTRHDRPRIDVGGASAKCDRSGRCNGFVITDAAHRVIVAARTSSRDVTQASPPASPCRPPDALPSCVHASPSTRPFVTLAREYAPHSLILLETTRTPRRAPGSPAATRASL